MPIVLRIGPYRFGFLSREGTEPMHVHVTRDDRVAKFWLEPQVELADNQGFPRHELQRLASLVLENRQRLVEAWHDHFDA